MAKAAKKTEPKVPFLDLKLTKLSKKAKAFHEEVAHMTRDLIRLDEEIQRTACLVGFVIKPHGKGAHAHAHIDPLGARDIENLAYHLENLAFRCHAWREKIALFANFAVELGYDAKEMGLIFRLESNGRAREANLHLVAKKILKNKGLSSTLEMRKMLTHRVYYHESVNPVRNRYLAPVIQPNKDRKTLLKEWAKNVRAEAKKAERMVLDIIKYNNELANRVSLYLYGTEA